MSAKLSYVVFYDGLYYTASDLQAFIENIISERDSWKQQYTNLVAAQKKQNLSLWQEGYNTGLTKAKQALNEIF